MDDIRFTARFALQVSTDILSTRFECTLLGDRVLAGKTLRFLHDGRAILHIVITIHNEIAAFSFLSPDNHIRSSI